MKVKVNKDRILEFFNYLNEPIENTNIYLKKKGLSELDYISFFLDRFEHNRGYICKNKEGKYGVIDFNGKIIVPFIYENENSHTLFEEGFHKFYHDYDENDYDIYSGEYGLIGSHVIYQKINLNLSIKNIEGKYLYFKTKDHKSNLYDYQFNKFLVKNIDCDCIYDVDLKNQLISISKEKKYYISDFKGNIKYEFPYCPVFTNIDDFYISYFKYKKCGLYYKNQELLQTKYKDFLQLFEDKVVVRNCQNRINIFYFDFSNLDKIKVKKDNYKFEKDIISIWILEDESDMIYTFSYKSPYSYKKTLKSFYDLESFGNYDLYDEIVPLKNGIFKCINGTTGTFEYYHNGNPIFDKYEINDNYKYHKISYNYSKFDHYVKNKNALISGDGTVIMPIINENDFRIEPFPYCTSDYQFNSLFATYENVSLNGIFRIICPYYDSYLSDELKTYYNKYKNQEWVNANANCNHEPFDSISYIFGNYYQKKNNWTHASNELINIYDDNDCILKNMYNFIFGEYLLLYNDRGYQEKIVVDKDLNEIFSLDEGTVYSNKDSKEVFIPGVYISKGKTIENALYYSPEIGIKIFKVFKQDTIFTFYNNEDLIIALDSFHGLFNIFSKEDILNEIKEGVLYKSYDFLKYI